MKTFSKEWFVIGVIVGLCFSALSWALTTDEIWQDIYDSTNHAIRVTVVP